MTDSAERLLHPLVEALATRHGASALTAAGADAFCNGPGARLLVFTEDPARYRETLDLAVIVPELARHFAGQFVIGVLAPGLARLFAPGFAVRRWPALVLVRDGGFRGTIEGLRTWDDYLAEMARLLAAPASLPPAIGVLATAACASGSSAGRTAA